MKIIFASNNPNKFREIAGLLPSNFKLLSPLDIGFLEDVEETGSTLEENSAIKARALFDFSGYATIADDTGLEVEALHGAPGVYSARYAGESKSSKENIEKLLAELNNQENRRAQFRTVFTFLDDQGEKQFEGTVTGEIIQEARGMDGFGYDPVFVPENENRTFAEMTLVEKNQMSHRARALTKLIEFLNQNYQKLD